MAADICSIVKRSALRQLSIFSALQNSPQLCTLPPPVSHFIYVDAKLQVEARVPNLVSLLDDATVSKHAVLTATRHPFTSSPLPEAEAIDKSKHGARPDISYILWTMQH
jgi:hypothetical protein